jgi:hypothetical protein
MVENENIYVKVANIWTVTTNVMYSLNLKKRKSSFDFYIVLGRFI